MVTVATQSGLSSVCEGLRTKYFMISVKSYSLPWFEFCAICQRKDDKEKSTFDS